jgi:hypothetical protein
MDAMFHVKHSAALLRIGYALLSCATGTASRKVFSATQGCQAGNWQKAGESLSLIKE